MLKIETRYSQTRAKFLLSPIIAKITKENFSTLLYSGKPLQNEMISHLYGYNPLAFIMDNVLFDYQYGLWYQIDNITFFMEKFLAQQPLKDPREFTDLIFVGGLMSFFTFEYKNLLEEKGLYKKKNHYSLLI